MSSTHRDLFIDSTKESSSAPNSNGSGRQEKLVKLVKGTITTGGDTEDDGSDSDDDPLTVEFDKIGRSVSFSIPDLSNLRPFGSFNLFGGKDHIDNSDRSISEFLLDQQLTQIFNKRRDQVTEFINDLTSGFSIQNALERLQAFRDVVQNTVELPVSDADEEATEPHGVVQAVEKQYPIIDELIIPQSSNDVTKRHRSKSLNKYNYLTNLSSDEFQNESFLRSRIKQILSLPVNENHKNKLIQSLMMRSYHEKVKQLSSSKEFDLNLKSSYDEGDDASIDSDISSIADIDNDDDDDDDDDEVILANDDLIPTYHPETKKILGCQHYQRNCKIECPICNRWYPCRFCHDQEVSSHQLPRAEIKHVLCMFCQTPQLPSQICVNEKCGEVLSHYYCEKCKLFDNDLNKDIYHCDDCGICRLGQGLNEDFFHCKGCNACISIDLQDHHKCIENSTHSNCTICGEYMFSSIKKVVFMQCGHPIHQSCFDEYTKHSYKCPICSRSIVNMEAQFRVLDQEISLQPLPEPYGSWKCIIQCNDCKAKSMAKYHILGLKCGNCKSYNTAQLKVLKSEQDLKDLEDRGVDQIDEELQQRSKQKKLSAVNNDDDEEEEEEYDDNDNENEVYNDDDNDDEVESLGNLINNDTLTSFDRYKEWFFSTMDSYLSQGETDVGADDEEDEDSQKDYEEDDYKDMR